MNSFVQKYDALTVKYEYEDVGKSDNPWCGGDSVRELRECDFKF
jgi:hypothetical protein